jgi:hypothetical protein
MGGIMNKLPCTISIIAIWLAALVFNPADAAAQTQWVGNKFYVPPATTITLPPLAPGGPSAGTVDALPAGTAAIFVSMICKT